MKKSLLLIIFALTASSFIVSGCGDDKSTNANDVIVVESLKEQATIMVNQLGDAFSEGFEYYNYGPGAGLGKPANTMSVIFDTLTCWWTSSIEGSLQGDSVTFEFSQLDSIHFTDEVDSCQMYPDSTTYYLQFRSNGNLFMSWTADSSFDFEHELSIDYEELNSDTVTINGAYQLYLLATEGSDSVIVDYNTDCSNVRFIDVSIYNDNMQPLSGTVSVSLHMADSREDVEVTVTISITFNETGYSGSMRYEGVTYTWDATWEEVQASAPGIG